MAFTAREFRDTLGLFPTGVAIVTVATGGERAGMTVSSFNSVSLEPPLVLFSIARSSLSLPLFARADCYAVNILGEDGTALSGRFARAMSDKWEGVGVRTGAAGAPILEEAIAWMECRPFARHDGGDHEIFVGRVIGLGRGLAPRPLVFHAGQYRKLDRAQGAEAPEIAFQQYGW